MAKIRELSSFMRIGYIIKQKKVFEEKIGHFSKVKDVIPKKIVVKNLKNRWEV